MNFFHAVMAVFRFRQFKVLALKYWNAQPPDDRDYYVRTSGVKAPESSGSIDLRQKINLLLPIVTNDAERLDAPINYTSYPAPAVGGPVIPVNILFCVVDQDMGHRPLSKQEILDAIDRCIGTAKTVRRHAFWRLILPWYWIIDIPATIARIPFLILRQAGLPPKVEENIISQFIKFLLIISMIATASYFGVKITFPDLLQYIGK